MIDTYASCPCGSGKKFKWCCQPIHVQIDKAFQQDQEGQHDAALRMMDDVVKEHPGNPEAWGRKALLLYNNERVDEAESACIVAGVHFQPGVEERSDEPGPDRTLMIGGVACAKIAVICRLVGRMIGRE